VWFDFFLTRPYERFTITRRTDIETTVLLLVIGVAVTEIAVWGRRHYAIASRRAGYLDGISKAAQLVAAGGSAAALIDQVSGQLTQLLSLRSCVFQYGVAGLGRPARLRRDGSVTFGRRAGQQPSGRPGLTGASPACREAGCGGRGMTWLPSWAEDRYAGGCLSAGNRRWPGRWPPLAGWR